MFNIYLFDTLAYQTTLNHNIMIKKLFSLKNIFGIMLLSSTISFAQNGLSFDGVDDIVTTTYSGISGSSARTIEAWIKTSSTNGEQQVIVDYGNLATGQRFTFNIINNSFLRLEVQGSGLSGTTVINDGNWHHVATVYDPNATNKVSLYVDGVLDIAGNFTTTVNTNLVTPVRIGRRIDNVKTFNGSIDEVRIWSLAKTQAEIQASMNVEFCATQPNLMGYYKFNQGVAGGANTSVVTVPDYSGNNNTGTLVNFTLTGATSNWVTGATLTQQTLDNSVTNDNAGTLTATLTGATYQWVDCNNSNTPIPGATAQTFSPTTVGSYAVVLTKNGCSATSACESVTTLGLTSNEFAKSISMYPNPTNGLTNIQLNQSFETIEATVYNVTGQTILNKEFKNTNIFSLDFTSSNGIYFLAIKTNSGENAVLKLMKQ